MGGKAVCLSDPPGRTPTRCEHRTRIKLLVSLGTICAFTCVLVIVVKLHLRCKARGQYRAGLG